MSDYSSSLPIKTENPGDVIVKIAGASVPNQQLEVNSDGSINVETAGVSWDEIVTTFPSADVEVFTYKLAGVLVQTITVTYESSLKKIPISIIKVKP